MTLVPFVVLIKKFKVQTSKVKVNSSKLIVEIIKFKAQSSKGKEFNAQRSKVKGGSRYLVGIGIYFGKSKKKETFIYNSS